MKINAKGIWLSDGTKLEQATQRTLRLAFAYRAGKKREAVADRVVQAIVEIRDKQWNAVEKACWIDNAIADGEIDGGVVLLIVAGAIKAGNKRAAKAKYSDKDRARARKLAKAMKGSTRQKSRELVSAIGGKAETIRDWLKK